MEHRGMLLYGVSTESRLTRLETIAEILLTREDLSKAMDVLRSDFETCYSPKKSCESFQADLHKINTKIDRFMLITMMCWLLGCIGFFFTFQNRMKNHIESVTSRAVLMQSQATQAATVFSPTVVHQPTAP